MKLLARKPSSRQLPPRETSAPDRPERPWIFGFLIAPSAVVANGVIQGGVLAFLLSQQGIGSKVQSHLISTLALPTSALLPLEPHHRLLRASPHLAARRWYALSGPDGARLPPEGPRFHRSALVLILLSACLSQLVVSSCGGMMGALHSERSKRVAGSFYQAGSMGLGALSVSVLIGLSPRVSHDVLGLAAGALIGSACALRARRSAAGRDPHRLLRPTMHSVWLEFKATFLRWRAIPYTLCMLFPIATGALVGLIPGVAKSYGVNGDNVAWVNGLLGGLVTAVGSLAGTALPARISAPVVYLSVGIVNAATLVVLWLGPMTPATYYLGVMLYLFTVGTAYGLFTAVVLEFLGASGKSGCGRYSIINSLGNFPVLYMIVVDGWGAGRWGARGLVRNRVRRGWFGSRAAARYFLLRRKQLLALSL